ncbi:MAG: beta-galactosidase, partial [Candidatus Saccharimonadales bacterium]|nr:beta-galactosidase [Candidatus Saccharimonadales bacterium]
PVQYARHLWNHKVKPYFQRHKYQRRTVKTVLTLLVLVVFIATIFRPVSSNMITKGGVSFSTKYARELGVDWEDAYVATLRDLDVNYLRLMSYWDEHEKTKDKYNFDELDKQFQLAEDYGAKVSLAVGLRQPRWPECHFPDWIDQDNRDKWLPELMEYIEVVVNRYKSHPALESYQLENEALNHWFGGCNVHDRKLIRERMIDEFELIKSLDPDHPIVISLSDQHGLPLGEPTPDIYGYSVYRVVYNSQILEGYFVYPTPVWYHRLRAWIIDLFDNRKILIHELQMEPWGPEPTVNLPIEEQDKSMGILQMYKNLDFARKIGVDQAYLWGAEWWYWRMTELNDPGPFNAAKDMFQQMNSGQVLIIPENI